MRTITHILALLAIAVSVQAQKPGLSFTVNLKDPAAHILHVQFRCSGVKKESIEFKLAAWTPGYYQFMNYADNVSAFHVTNGASTDTLSWSKVSANGWKVDSKNNNTLVIDYDVKAPRAFVAATYADAERAYLSPAGVFLYPDGMINQPVTVTVVPLEGWNTVATGLEPVPGKANTFTAPDYDVLYDSPFLMGQLESFPTFTVNNIPHNFVAFKPGDFDKARLMNDLQKIVTAASNIIGDIPYRHYTFLAIGPGGGGIEHLNSASISFAGARLYGSKTSMITMYNFLAHEYFHHYNVKRIRPIELGPFDYDKGSRTKMLWLSEGITVYYEYIILKRAGFTDADEVFKTFSASISAYENKPGRQFQTPADASFTTWEDGPFGRTGDDANKTISPYDKGPALGILLDFKIRHETKNKRSLDDLMRLLYNKYYKEKNRGFTEAEFRKEAETVAGTSLADFFDYIYTLKTVDYPTYFNYAGLAIDTATHDLPGAWLGANVRSRNDSVFIASVDWQSPAWNAGMRPRGVITKINGEPANEKLLKDVIAAAKNGDQVKIAFTTATANREENIRFGTKKEKNFTITRIASPDALQKEILAGWLGEK